MFGETEMKRFQMKDDGGYKEESRSICGVLEKAPRSDDHGDRKCGQR